MSYRRPFNTRQALAGLQIALSTVPRPNPIVIAWRWRYELALTAVLPLGLAALANAAGPILAATGLAVLPGLITLWPAARRLLVTQAWRVITPHRIRTACAQAWIHSRAGKIPIILLTSAEPFGERVLVWCRAGTSIEDFDSARSLLAAACWAHEAVLTRSERFAQLVTIDVIRRAAPCQPKRHDCSPGQQAALRNGQDPQPGATSATRDTGPGDHMADFDW
jgi:hypothetical protein